MRIHPLTVALLLACNVSFATGDRDLLGPPNPLRAGSSVSSAGPASYRTPRSKTTAPLAQAAELIDPFAVQSAFDNIQTSGLETAPESDRSTTLSVVSADFQSKPVAPTPPAKPAVNEPAIDLAPPAIPAETPSEEPTTEIAAEPTVPVAPPVASEPIEPRRLSFTKAETSAAPGQSFPDPFEMLASWDPQSETLVTAGSGLALVLGLLLLSAWVMRKAQPRGNRPLPKEVAEVLGRAPLGGRNHAQLLRLGNKLVLVSVAPDHAETICEITDESEVARLRALCDEGAGSTAAFDELFGQMTSEPADEGFLGGGYDAQRLAAAYANTPGGRQYA